MLLGSRIRVVWTFCAPPKMFPSTGLAKAAIPGGIYHQQRFALLLLRTSGAAGEPVDPRHYGDHRDERVNGGQVLLLSSWLNMALHNFIPPSSVETQTNRGKACLKGTGLD